MRNRKTAYPKDKDRSRKVFNHEFLSPDEYIDALRDTGNGRHKKAMAVTTCHDCMNFMLPVSGYYIKEDDAALLEKTTDDSVKFLCTCESEKMLTDIAKEWGFLEKVNITTQKFKMNTF